MNFLEYECVCVCVCIFPGEIPKKRVSGQWGQGVGGRRRRSLHTSYHSGLFQFVACASAFIFNRFFKVVLIITPRIKSSDQDTEHRAV